MPEILDYAAGPDQKRHHPVVYTIFSVILWIAGAVGLILTLAVFLFGISGRDNREDMRLILIVSGVGAILSTAAFFGSAVLERRTK